MKVKKILLAATIFFAVSCSNELNEDLNVNAKDIVGVPSDSEYLKFDSGDELKDLLNDYIAIETGTLAKSGKRGKTPAGFVSLAELEERQTSLTKNASGTSDSETEESTLEEFNVAMAKSLLKDPVLWNVFDTTLRIGVENMLYKITEHGTFFAEYGKESELYDIVANFERIKNEMNISDDDSTVIAVSPNVKYFNSFRNSPVKSIIVTNEDANPDDGDVERMSTKAVVNSTSEYGLVSCRWSVRGWLPGLWAKMFGTCVTRENRYPSNARVTVELFDVNYIVYASSGVKVKVEKLKKFLFWKYWADQYADKFAIGFNKFQGTLTHNHPPRSLNPLPGDKYNMFFGYFNNAYKEFIYRGYYGIDFVRDWTSRAISFVPKISFNIPFGQKISLDQYLKNQVKDIVEYPAERVYNWFNTQVNKNIYDPVKASLQGQISPKSPMALYLLWGTSNIAHYIQGVEEYGRGKIKTIRFDQSFGISVKIAGGSTAVTPFLPSSYTINDIDMFGAAYFEGTWRGVRFYK
jgi:hypothetical protein